MLELERAEIKLRHVRCALRQQCCLACRWFVPWLPQRKDRCWRGPAIPFGRWIAVENVPKGCFGDRQNAQGLVMPKLDRDGVKLHYEVHGSGPALLLTHGYSSTSAMWKGQIEALSQHHQ